jgi:DNA processing protein
VPTDDLRDWVAFHLLDLSPRDQTVALARFGGPGRTAWRVAPESFAALGDRAGPSIAERIRRVRKDLARNVERELAACGRAGIDIIPRTAESYPSILLETADPPAVLYVRGHLDPRATRVAIVGSRRATVYGRRVATSLASDLAALGVVVVSGGARGIDSCAHRGALTVGGPTLAVVGSGLDRPYPPENARLYAEIAEHGAVVSEFRLDAAPLPGRFPRRNRIVAGLCAAVVVVEAAERSGSLITARMGADLGREVLAVPGPITSDRSTGTHRLIQSGAKLVLTVQDVIDELPPGFEPREVVPAAETDPGPAASEGTPIGPDERAILALLDAVEAIHLDRLAEQVPFGIARLQAALFGLELRGAVEPLPGRYYCCPPRKER